MLLRWCLPSGPGEDEACTRAPLDLHPVLARELTRLALSFDAVLRRLADALLAGSPDLPPTALPRFPFLPELLTGGPLREPFFWGRFDVFERADGGLAVLEYNCDKPTSQREIWASAEAWRGRGNPNRRAR